MLEVPCEWPKNFVFADEKWRDRLSRIRDMGGGAVHLVADWDNTLVGGKHAKDSATTWRIARKHFTDDARAKHSKLYDRYYPKEQNGTLSDADALGWQSSALDLLQGIRLEALLEDARQAEPRKGAAELVQLCKEHDIPLIIVSAGIKQIIETVLAQHGVEGAIVRATELYADDQGIITGWNENTIVHARNKSMIVNEDPAIAGIRAERQHGLVLGDDTWDTQLASGAQESFTIRVDGSYSSDIRDARQRFTQRFREHVQESFELRPRYDAVSTCPDLEGVASLAAWLTQPGNPTCAVR